MRVRRRQRDRESHQNRYRPPCCRSGCPRTGTRPCNIRAQQIKRREEKRRDQRDVHQLTAVRRERNSRNRWNDSHIKKKTRLVRQIRLHAMNNGYSAGAAFRRPFVSLSNPWDFLFSSVWAAVLFATCFFKQKKKGVVGGGDNTIQ